MKRLWATILSALLTLLSVAAVVTYLTVPGMWQWAHATALVEAKKPHQIDTAEQPVDAGLVERLSVTGDGTEFGPVILTYHDISPHGDSQYTVTPEEFASQMRMLHDAGWTTLTSDQMAAWVAGGPIDRHSFMLTFDDGTKGVWQYADPILARYGFHAAAFIITGSVGTHAPYYMTWEQIEELNRTGRWDFEAHTHAGHIRVPIDPNGGEEAFMTATQWLVEQNRRETHEEHHTRVLNDLVECKRQLVAHTGRVPKFFAYPFSAHEEKPGDADVEVQQIVLSLYLVGMLDDALSTRVTGPDDLAGGFIRRMDTTGGTTPGRFVQKIEEATTT